MLRKNPFVHTLQKGDKFALFNALSLSTLYLTESEYFSLIRNPPKYLEEEAFFVAEDFDFYFQKSIDKKKITELATLAFLNHGDNVIFVGPPGVGKTHLSVALAIVAAKARQRIKFTTLLDMITSLQRAFEVGNLANRLAVYVRPRLLVIDEVGFLPLDRAQSSLLFQVVCRRYEHGSIIVTSNKSYSEWAEIFSGDEVIAAAILDRLLHHSTTISIRGESYRLREKKKAGLIGTKGGDKLLKTT